MMNTNTPAFRAALTIAALWLAASAYLSYADYRDAYESTEFAAYGIPKEATTACFSSVLDGSKSGFVFRDQTSEEKSDCYARAAQQHVQSIESSNQLALEQAWKSFSFNGVLPAVALLGIVALWSTILIGANRTATGYLSWLRFGSKKPNSECKRDL